MSTAPYARERDVAISAVLKASLLSRKVHQTLVKDETVTKSDASPVTVADYAAQALISSLLSKHFDYPLIAEEDTSDLGSPEQSATLTRVVELANSALNSPASISADETAWVNANLSEKTLQNQDWLAAIDRGSSAPPLSVIKEQRVWTLDPIDGTKGFLRGGQYAVCLALLEKGEPVVAVIGTPNLGSKSRDAGEQGTLFIAVKGQGAFQRTFTSAEESPIKMSNLSPSNFSEASFCESVEAGHTSKPLNARIASLLGITKPAVTMDSQAKYCSIARGDGDVYLRLPVKPGYEEKIWDHASGNLLVHEAGGVVSDMDGKPLDFSLGRTLKNNKGVVAATKELHPAVITAVKQALEEQKQGKL